MEELEKQIDNTDAAKPKRKRWSGLKIALVSLLSLVGVVILVLVVALWLILTPSKLTGIVNKLSDKFILCESGFDNVDLTLFKTFPYVGLEVEGVNIINPTAGAKSDTVASIDNLVVGVNLREFLKNNNIEVTKLLLINPQVNLYTDSAGNSNFDIFPKSDNVDTPDTSSFTMPELVSLQSIKIKKLTASYIDEQNNLAADIANLYLNIDGEYNAEDVDVKLDLKSSDISVSMDSTLTALLGSMSLSLKGKTVDGIGNGKVKLSVPDGQIALGGVDYVNDELAGTEGDLVSLSGDLSGEWGRGEIKIKNLVASLKQYSLTVNGDVSLPADSIPMCVDVDFETNTWGVDRLVSSLPESFREWKGKMKLDADASVRGHAKGNLGNGQMPLIDANLLLKNGKFSDRSIIPYDLTSVAANINARLNLNEDSVSNVKINKIEVTAGRNKVNAEGNIHDLLGTMNTTANVRGSVFLADLSPFIPDSLNLDMDGKADLNLHVETNLEQLQKSRFDKMRLSGSVGVSDLNVALDSIYAKVPSAKIDVALPSKGKNKYFKELLSANIELDKIDADLPQNDIVANASKPTLKASLSNIFDTTQPVRICCDFGMEAISGNMDTVKASVSNPSVSFAMLPESKQSDKTKYNISFSSDALHCSLGDSMNVDLAGLSIKGGANHDPSIKNNVLQQWSPNLDVDFKRGYINMSTLDYMVQIPDIKFNYKPERCEISSANVVFGNSDFYLSGAVTGLEKWLSHEEMLKGDLFFTSNYTNVDDLMDALSGLGSDSDTLEAQRKEDKVDTSAHPFIVPRDVDFTLHTRIKDATAFGNELQEVAGDVQIRNGVAVLNQVGFMCKAARMQLTGMYKTPRVNHIFVGLDFHLLDINIQELIDMIPYVDTLVPLLNDLEGAADFHLCAETYVDAFYKPKMSTLRAAAALTGQNLVVLDNKDIDRIAKLLQLKSWRENDSKIHVDSLDVAMTVFRRELEVYPFLLSLHKYQIVAEGRHSLSNTYDYHVELVQTPLPVRLAVDVFGKMPDLKFDISPKLRYKNLYRPARRNDVDEHVLKLKAMIRQSLEANVKESTREYEGFE